MKSRSITGVMVLFLFLIASLEVSADVPHLINYQGYMSDSTGTPLDTTTSLTFIIYNDTLKTTELWRETHNSVIITKGAFSVLLGSVNPLPQSVFDGSVRGMALQVEAGPESTPSLAIVSVAYAYRALLADTAEYAQTSGSGDSSMWNLSGSTLETNDYWAIGRGGTGNLYYGDSIRTMVNLGVGSQVGLNGQSYYYATVGGGWQTKARHNFATVGGGDRNNAGGEHSTIGGGRANSITTDAQRATIAGGNGNIASGPSSFIGGGGANQAIGSDAIVVGG